MWDFLSSMIRSFLLLRDVVGYLIPGSLLLGSVIYRHGFDWATKSWPGGPDWLAVVAAVIGCYATGQVLVAIGYTIYEIVGRFHKRSRAPASDQDVLLYRYVYPDLFIESDRRNTINILRIGIAVALVTDFWLLTPPLSYIALILGLLMLYNGYTGMIHIGAFSAATVNAGHAALKYKVPFVTRK